RRWGQMFGHVGGLVLPFPRRFEQHRVSPDREACAASIWHSVYVREELVHTCVVRVVEYRLSGMTLDNTFERLPGQGAQLRCGLEAGDLLLPLPPVRILPLKLLSRAAFEDAEGPLDPRFVCDRAQSELPADDRRRRLGPDQWARVDRPPSAELESERIRLR